MTLVNQQPTFEDLELLVKVSELLTLRDLNKVMQEVIDLTKSAVDAGKASLILFHGLTVDWDHIFTARDLDATDSIRVVNKVLDKGLAGWVMRTREPAIIHDTENDERWHVFPDDVRTVRSAMSLPFINDGEVIAVLTLDHPEPDHFTEYQLRLMTIIINQATVALRNAQLFSQLQSNERQLATVLRSVPDVLLVTDNNNQIILVNDGAVELLAGGNAEEIVNVPLADMAEKHDVVAAVLDVLNNMRPGMPSESLEFHSHQLERDFAIMISPWEGSDHLGGYAIVMHDVTKLHDLSRFKDEILHIVSHDLRSPLGIIAGYTDMLQLDLPEDSPMNMYVDDIRNAVERTTNLLEDLLKVRQIDEKGLNLEPNTVLQDLVSHVVQDIRPRTEQKGQELVIESHLDESMKGVVDPTLLGRAMENFASNAVKYTPEGGRIILRAYVRDRTFFFEVEDNGIGIPEESIPHLFESFYRVNPRANASIMGAGLGLSLVQSIVRRHQGDVWVESEVGVGSLFGLWVPI